MAASYNKAILLCVAAGLAPPAWAPPQKQQEAFIDAASSIIDYRNNITLMQEAVITQGDIKARAKQAEMKGGGDLANTELTLLKDVSIVTANGTLASDQAHIVLADKRVTHATVTGSPATFEQKLDNGKDTVRGRAGIIEYDFRTGLVKLTKEVWFSNGQDEYEFGAEVVVYNVNTAVTQLNPDGQSGRVKGIIRRPPPSQAPTGSSLAPDAAG